MSGTWTVGHYNHPHLSGYLPLLTIVSEDEKHALVRCNYCAFFAWRSK